jgi:CheY-like chemotaxis protein
MQIRECTRDDASFAKMLDLYVDLARQASKRASETRDDQIVSNLQQEPLKDKKPELNASSEAPLIAVIDDSASLNDIVRRVLEHEGFRVSTWLSPLSLLEGKEEVPALMLLDIEMPEMNGAVAMDRFKEDRRFANTKIIFMTGLVSPTEATELSLPGKTAYLSKPFTKEKLVEMVKKGLS